MRRPKTVTSARHTGIVRVSIVLSLLAEKVIFARDQRERMILKFPLARLTLKRQSRSSIVLKKSMR